MQGKVGVVDVEFRRLRRQYSRTALTTYGPHSTVHNSCICPIYKERNPGDFIRISKARIIVFAFRVDFTAGTSC